MKCSICQQIFYYENLNQLVSQQQICNICMDLFIYKQKNVKIRCVKIEIFYLVNYNYLIRFLSKDKCLSFNHYSITKNRLIDSNSEFSQAKTLSFYYYQTTLYLRLMVILKKIDVNKNTKIRIFELLM